MDKRININKVVRLGTAKAYAGRDMNIYCKIKYNEGKLSISGVEGPLPNGNCLGSCGQIGMTKSHIIDLATGWDRAMLKEFWAVWKRWHLNDMKANCEHQTGEAWTSKDVNLYHFRLKPEVTEEQEKIREKVSQVLIDGKPYKPTKKEMILSAINYAFIYHKERLPKKLANHYEPKKKLYNSDIGYKETEKTGWLNEEEHPKGFLSKPCPVCKHKYGSTWLKEEVPNEVLEFLKSLPETDKTPAWV